jgi:hypothetical protein
MSDEKQAGQEVGLAVPVEATKMPKARRAAAAPAAAKASTIDQLKVELPEEAAPPAPEQNGSGIHDPFGAELPTQEQYVKAGGLAEAYDAYVVSRCAVVAPEPAAAPEPPKRMVGKALAESLLAEAYRKRTGQSIEPPLREDELKEDWEEVQPGKRPAPPAELAGLYQVTHGTIFFHNGKIVPKGRKVMLSAADAKAFLELEMVRPLSTAA